MNITLEYSETKDKVQSRIDDLNAALSGKPWTKMANGEYGQSRVNEGKQMLAEHDAKIRQLEDIKAHTPDEPMTTIIARNAYAEKDMLKANGFRWDGMSKVWYRRVRVAELDNALDAIGAQVARSERIMAGVS